ncbi:MAG: VCBS repeat-containing protein, partial [Planctomycetaceae bacterium]|nr:VCBS repeat-containing protein [Planctomycetaceae bacterium]
MRLTQWLQGLFPRFSFPQALRRPRRVRANVLARSGGASQVRHLGENLEDRTLLSALFVDGSFAGVAAGQDPDGAGPATAVGIDAFSSIQEAIDYAQSGDSLHVATGTYAENLTIGKSLTITGTTGVAADVVIAPVTGDGLVIDNVSVGVADLTISSIDGTAVELTATAGAHVDLQLSNVVLDGAGQDALTLLADGATVTGMIANSSMNDAGQHAFNAAIDNGANVTLRMEYTPTNRPQGDGLHITAANSAFMNLDIIDGSLLDAGGDAINIVQDTNSHVDLFVDPTPINRGFKFFGENGTALTAEVLDSPLSTAADQSNFGVFGELFTGASMDLIVRNSSSDSTIVDGVFVTAVGDVANNKKARFTATFENSPITNSGRRGVALDLNYAEADVTFTNSPVFGSASTNVYVKGVNQSAANLLFEDFALDMDDQIDRTMPLPTNLSNAGVDGIFLSMNDGSVGTIDFNDAVILDSAGRDGILLAGNNGGSATIRALHGLSVNGAGSDGVVMTSNGGAILLDASGVSIAGAAENAVWLQGQNGGRIITKLANTTSLAGAGESALKYTLDSGFGSVNLTPTAGGTIDLDGAGADGVYINAFNGASAVLKLTDFSLVGSGGHGVNINLDNASMSGSFLANGQIKASGDLASTTAGIRLSALNNSNVGVRAGATTGLAISNVFIGNDLLAATVQDFGFQAILDGNSYVGVRFTNSDINQNGSDGVNVVVNDDQSLMDSSYLSMIFGATDVQNNQGDGFHLYAYNGTGTLAMQDSGINLNYAGGLIVNNGNANPGDGIGDGIEAVADGDGSAPGNTIITLTNLNFDLSGNDEQSFNTAQLDGGVVRRDLTGGTVDSLVLCATSPLDVQSLSLNGTMVMGGLVLCAENGGTVEATIQNINFIGTVGAGVVFRARTGGTIRANLENVIVQNSGPNVEVNTGLGGTGAIIGLVEGGTSFVEFNLDGVVVEQATTNGMSGLDVDVTGGATFQSTIRNSRIQGNLPSAGTGEVDIRVDASTAMLDVDGLTVQSSRAKAINLIATNGSTLEIPQFNNITANGAREEGLNLQVTDSLLPQFSMFHGRFNNPIFTGVNIGVTNSAAPTIISLNDVQGENAGRFGVNVTLNAVHGGQSVVTANQIRGQRAQLGNGMRIHSLNMGATDSVAINVGGNSLVGFAKANNGLDIRTTGSLGSVAAIDIDGVNATGTIGTGVNISVQGSTVADIVANNITTLSSRAFGVGVNAPGAAAVRSFTSTGVNARGSFWAALNVDLDGQAIPAAISVSNFDGDNSGRRGIQILENGVTGGLSTINLDNVTAQNLQTANGLYIFSQNMAGTDSLEINMANSNFSNAKSNNVQMQFRGAAGAQVTLNANSIISNDSDNSGFSINFGGNVTGQVPQFNNITATNNARAGVSVTVPTTAELLEFTSSFVDVSGAGTGAGLYMHVNNQANPTNISFDSLNASNAGRAGVDINLIDIEGTSNVSLTNVVAIGAGTAEGLDFSAVGLGATDAVNLTLNSVDFSTAFHDAVHLHLEGVAGSMATIMADGLTAQMAGDDGIDLELHNGITVDVAQFDNVQAQFNEENGLKVLVDTTSKLSEFAASSLNLSNNATSGVGFDGIDVQVHHLGSEATFNFSSLTVDNSGGRGIDLDVYDNGVLTFNVDGGSISGADLGGLDLNIGSLDEFGTTPTISGPATFTGTFKDLDVSGNGQSVLFARDGINVDIRGTSTTATVNFDHVSANNNDDDGFDIRVTNNAVASIDVSNGSTGNANGTPGGLTGVTGRGFKLVVDDAITDANRTQVTFTSSPAIDGTNNVFDNNVNGPGFEVTLSQGVQAHDLTINASASGNAGDGVRVIANDGSGVDVANFGLAGTGLQVNGNTGNGLFVDFFKVTGITSFSLDSATVSANVGDQIFTRFREMNFTDFSLQNVTVTGTGGGTSDGIEVQLIDSQVTNRSTTGVLAGFVVNNVHANNNGGYGLNLSVEEADLNTGGAGNGVQTSGIAGGIITQSEFAQNGLAGARLQFGGDSVNDFDIFENVGAGLGFKNNSGRGLYVQIQDFSTLTIDGASAFDPATKSFYDNEFTGNGNVGVHFLANEPGDTDLTNSDRMGPRFDLELGDILRDRNTIQNNRDAAMLVEAKGDALGTFTITSSLLANTQDLAGTTNLAGDGLVVDVGDFAALEKFILDGTDAGINIDNNRGSGLVTKVSRSGRLGTATPVTVLNTTIQGNNLHGIDVQRRDNGLYGPDATSHRIVLGQNGRGNILQNNQQNGINVVNENKPGQPVALDLDISDNTFTNNLNGIFVRGTGNAQFAGNISDNDLTANRSDGIEVVLENDATLGNPVVAPSFTTGNGPSELALGDINNDGHQDMLVTNLIDGTVTVMLGSSRGTFLRPQNVFGDPDPAIVVGNSPVAITMVDLNGDDFDDAVVVNQADDTVTSLLSNGDGTFTNAGTFAAGTSPNAIETGDFNGDLIPDIAVTGQSSNDVNVLIGNGDGTFGAAIPTAVGTGPVALGVGHFDGDNILDMVVVNGTSANATVLLGNGDGTMAVAGTIALGGSPSAVLVANLNGDTDINDAPINDLVFVNAATGSIRYALGNGTGTFAALVNAVPTSPFTTLTDVSAGFFNDDDYLDLAVTGRSFVNGTATVGSHILLADQQPDGSLSNPLSYTLARSIDTGTATGLATGRLDADSLDDIATSTSGANTVRVVRGNAAFVMDGNQILNNTRQGIFFDTNFTNESGNFGG